MGSYKVRAETDQEYLDASDGLSNSDLFVTCCSGIIDNKQTQVNLPVAKWTIQAKDLLHLPPR